MNWKTSGPEIFAPLHYIGCYYIFNQRFAKIFKINKFTFDITMCNIYNQKPSVDDFNFLDFPCIQIFYTSTPKYTLHNVPTLITCTGEKKCPLLAFIDRKPNEIKSVPLNLNNFNLSCYTLKNKYNFRQENVCHTSIATDLRISISGIQEWHLHIAPIQINNILVCHANCTK